MTIRTSADIDGIIRAIRDADEAYRIAEQTEAECEAETQDILHALELNTQEDDAARQAALARRLIDVRMTRRQAKDAQDVLGHVADWVDKNGGAIKALERTLGGMRAAEERHINRVYIPRTAAGEAAFNSETDAE